MIDYLAPTADASALVVHWEDGGVSMLPAAHLRAQAQDAWSIRERLDQGDLTVTPDITITGLEQVGAAGVNVHFSDGHHRAIYPFVYLRELSERLDK